MLIGTCMSEKRVRAMIVGMHESTTSQRTREKSRSSNMSHGDDDGAWAVVGGGRSGRKGWWGWEERGKGRMDWAMGGLPKTRILISKKN